MQQHSRDEFVRLVRELDAAAASSPGTVAQLIRIEATLCGRFSPGCKEAQQGSEDVF